ncbi:MAG: STELLO glycosyltransferase family protein [Bacteroidetes bacterium]|nr:STELLO glycosyltransferase family protein [Bacteroidota bacterium]
MNSSTSLVITSIAGSGHPVLKDFAKRCKEKNIPFIVIGDKPSPPDFHLDGCSFYNLQQQRELDFSIAGLLPERHYSRKNIGYLVAIKNNHAEVIVETDDDNYARSEFWEPRNRLVKAHPLDETGWTNIYSYFTPQRIWPRGFALEHLQDELPSLSKYPMADVNCPIQQGLADENPDVDAIYRLILPLPLSFEKKSNVALGKKSWCPFNSQNTTWFKEAFPLLYLPSYCSFRMTDIWRSFVAHRIACGNDWHLLFHNATVYQERNMHNLMRDFADEISGYTNNLKIVDTLDKLNLKKGSDFLGENLLTCYEALIGLSLIDKKEIPLIEAWIKDLGA